MFSTISTRTRLFIQPDRGPVETVTDAANASEVHGSRSQPILQRSNLVEVSSIELSRSDSALPPPHSLLGVSWRDASEGLHAHHTEVGAKLINQCECKITTLLCSTHCAG